MNENDKIFEVLVRIEERLAELANALNVIAKAKQAGWENPIKRAAPGSMPKV